MYISLLLQYAKENKFVKPQPPATEYEVQNAEKQLNIRFPDELREFLHEVNGDNFLCLSINRIIEDNLRLRRNIDSDISDLSNFLFFATNGCGDFYGYKVDDGEIKSTAIYMWDHEEFKTRIAATNIINLINLYYQDQI